MRVPFGHGARGKRARGCLLALLACLSFGATSGFAQGIGTTPYVRETGRVNFVTTGGSLRNSSTNTCSVTASSTTMLSGVPTVGTTTIVGAYLYWGGSGSLDSTVTFNGSTVTAQRTFSTTYSGVSPSLPFFGAMASIPANLVNVNANNTFTNLTVNVGSPHCDVSAVASGWSLIVIYSNPNERVRAVNLYDGLDWFRGSSVTLNPAGFRVPNSNIDGRIAIFTLEGDPANSNAMNGVSEALRFNGNLLDDGINVPGSDPLVQQFDGTINTQGIQTSYGIDVDQYNISAFLSPGQTSGTTIYSSGEDLVLLMAQIVSATSDPGVDLGITKTHTGNFVAGSIGTYTLTVSNSSAALIEREDNTVTVTDTLPTGLTFNSATGTGWTCGAVGQVVTCTHAAPLNVGASFPPITLNVNVLETAAASVVNTATVTTPSFELNAANNTVTDTTTVLFPNLSTSTKTVTDPNGGEANPGDTLRYTITLTESAGQAASGVSVTDHIPANVTFANVVSVPAGATSSFQPAPNGDNDTGILTVSNISVPANGSVTVVFDVVVANVSPNSAIANTASVNNPNGPDATPSAPTVLVSPSQAAGSGTKQLYLWSNSQRLSRIQPTGTHAAIALNGNNQSTTFTMTPALQAALTLNSGAFNVNLLLARSGASTNQNRTITVSLTHPTLGTIATATSTLNAMPTTTAMYTFTMTTTGVTVPVNSALSLVVNNNSANTSNRQVTLTPYSGAQFSRVDLNSATIINVNSITTWNAAFNGGSAQGTFYPGATVYVRAQISDPFGSFDISAARITIRNPASVDAVTDQAMTAQGAPATCNSQTASTCIYQYAFALPANAPAGGWTVRVTGVEGVEGVTDLGVGSFVVQIPQPSLTIVKSTAVVSAPVTTLPKRIPSAVVRYDIVVSNSGPGTVDSSTLVITDSIPANTAMYVATTSGNPVTFSNGTTPSGLTFNYPTNVAYSSVGDTGPWTYTPVPDADGFDPLVRAVRITPSGVMSAAAGGNNPSFTLQFRVRIN